MDQIKQENERDSSWGRILSFLCFQEDLDSIGSFDSDYRLFIEDKTENKKKKPNKKPSSNIDPCLININKAYDECIKLCQDRIHDQSYQRECITICNDSIGKFVPE